MDKHLLRLLHRLALPHARLVWRDYERDFGYSFWSLEGSEWAECVHDAGLIEQLFNPEAGWLTRVSAAHDKYVFEISENGRAALAAAEKSNESQTAKG